MKTLQLNPEQILTTHDFPVHNGHILKLYFKMAKEAPLLIPPTPLLHISQGLPLLPADNVKATTHNHALQAYFQKNPQIEYIMLDGSHKTTALTLTHNPIHALVLETNDDIQTLFQMVEAGELFGFNNPNTIAETIADAASHQSISINFQTIASKTQRMVTEKVIPQYMIDHWALLKNPSL